MALFGLPGGAEWLVIAGIAILVFAPSLALFGLGYVLGRRSGPSALPVTDRPEPKPEGATDRSGARMNGEGQTRDDSSEDSDG